MDGDQDNLRTGTAIGAHVSHEHWLRFLVIKMYSVCMEKCANYFSGQSILVCTHRQCTQVYTNRIQRATATTVVVSDCST